MSFHIEGMDGLMSALDKIADIPDEVKTDALKAMADLAASEIKKCGKSMQVRDPTSNVHILDSISPKKAVVSANGGYADVVFSGSRTRNGIKTNNEEIAFENEYGNRHQIARPFVGTAMAKNADLITALGLKILGDWIEKTFES